MSLSEGPDAGNRLLVEDFQYSSVATVSGRRRLVQATWAAIPIVGYATLWDSAAALQFLLGWTPGMSV